MKKEAHVLRFNIYLNEDISFDEKTVYLSSEQEGYDSYEEGYNRTKNEYFNERRIQEMKEEICRKIMESPSPFDISLNDIDLYEVDEEEIWK